MSPRNLDSILCVLREAEAERARRRASGPCPLSQSFLEEVLEGRNSSTVGAALSKSLHVRLGEGMALDGGGS